MAKTTEITAVHEDGAWAFLERIGLADRWEQLTFLHWRQDPERVQRLLPAGLVVDTCDGAAWVSVVPFRQRVRLAAMPYLPWLATFRQMNVRTYVRGPDGQPAVWFLSIDAERLGAAVVARWSYGIPYMWARMRMETAGDIGVYGARRRWPGPAGARCHIAVRVGPPYRSAELGPLDRFLMVRWGFYGVRAAGLVYTPVDHAPWPLFRARVLHVDETLLAGSGLPVTAEPLAHYSPGVEVRIGRPRAVCAGASPRADRDGRLREGRGGERAARGGRGGSPGARQAAARGG